MRQTSSDPTYARVSSRLIVTSWWPPTVIGPNRSTGLSRSVKSMMGNTLIPPRQRAVGHVAVRRRGVEDEVMDPSIARPEAVHRDPFERVGDVEDPDPAGAGPEQRDVAGPVGEGGVDCSGEHRVTDRNSVGVGDLQPRDPGRDGVARRWRVVLVDLDEPDGPGRLGSVHLLLERE